MNTAEQIERERISAILGSDMASRTPKLAEALAFNTSLDAAAVNDVLAAAALDVEAAAAAPKPAPQPVPSRRTTTPTANLGFPESTEQANGTPSAVAGWKKAVGAVNGDDPHGWGKAMSYRKEPAAG